MFEIEFDYPAYPLDENGFDEISRTFRPVSLASMGVHRPIKDVETANVTITGRAGPLNFTFLRYFTDDDNVILTQLLSTENLPFESAIVAPICEGLYDAEERILISAYRHAIKASASQSDRPAPK